MNERPTTLTITEAARWLGCSTDTVRRRIKSGELPALLFAGKYRINPVDVAGLLRRPVRVISSDGTPERIRPVPAIDEPLSVA